MIQSEELIKLISQIYSKDGKGEKEISTNSLTVGIVVDTDDPLQQGRLRIFCPSLNDNPKKLHHLPWALQVSPFGGSINNNSFTRGSDPSNCTTSGAVQYGFWGVPEQGAHAIVGCLDGDPRRRFYIGTFHEHQETHGILVGRYKWDGNSVDGPLSSKNSPIEPQYSNMLKAFEGDNSSFEWKTRVADYQASAIREDEGQIPNSKKSTYLDQQYESISNAEEYSWVKPILGSHGYDWTGYKGLGSFLSSRVYGFSSPGFHALMMDDRPFNSRMKFKTTAGHTILLDDTNERVYISTYEGNNYIEMDVNGNIDIYSKRRVSIHSEKDINLSSDETVRILGKKGIHMYAGYNESQPDLDSIPADGQIRFQAEDDIHVITRKNYRHLSIDDTLFEIGGKKCETIGESLYLQVQDNINIITNRGNYNLTVSSDLNEIVQGNTNKFAMGTMKMASDGNAQIHSFDGKMDIGSQLTTNIKSMSQDVTLEAVGANSGATGGIFVKSPESQFGVSSGGITSATNKSIKSKAAETIEDQAAVPTDQNYPLPSQDIGDCQLGNEPLPIDGYSGADLAARLAYNAGFRGDGLVTATAIAGGESSYNPGAVGDIGLQNDKWGPSVGMWQIRTLKNPGDYSGIDVRRDINEIGGSQNAQNNANVAYLLSKQGTSFRDWSVFTSGAYKNYLDTARSAVLRMCNPESQQLFNTVFEAGFPTSLLDSCLSSLENAIGTSIKMSATGLDMKTLVDINMTGALMSTTMFSGVVSKLNELTLAHDLLSLATGTAFAAMAIAGGIGGVIAAAAAFLADLQSLGDLLQLDISLPLPQIGAVIPLPDLGLLFDLANICSYQIPFFDSDAELIFRMGNFDLNGGTIII